MIPNSKFVARARGFVLISSLLLLLVVTILAVTMFRSFGVDEKIAGNTRDKELALEAAQSAQQFAVNWLVSQADAAASPSITGVNCTVPVASAVGQICSNALGIPGNVPWAAQVNYKPPNDNIVNPQVTILSGQPNPTGYYIQSLNPAAPNVNTYKIDAMSYGASPTTIAVVEGYYQLSCKSIPC